MAAFEEIQLLRQSDGLILPFAPSALPQNLGALPTDSYRVRRVNVEQSDWYHVVDGTALISVGAAGGIVSIGGVTGTSVTLVVAGAANHNGSYTFDLDDLATGPLILSPAGYVGTAEVGGSITVIPPLVVGREADGVPLLGYQILRNDVPVATGLTYAVVEGDESLGIKVRATATNAAGAVSATTLVIPQPPYAENSVLAAGAGLYGTGALATNLLAFASWTVTQVTSTANIMEVDCGKAAHSNAYSQIRQTTTGLTLRFFLGNAGYIGSPTITGLKIGDVIEVIAFARRNYHLVLRRVNGGEWVTFTTSAAQSPFTLPFSGRIDVGVRSGVTGQAKFHRVALWSDIDAPADFMVTDNPALPALFVEPGGRIKNPEIAAAQFGSPLIDICGPASDWNANPPAHLGSVALTKYSTGTFTDA